MQQPPNYFLEKSLHSDANVEIYAGVRASDGARVVLTCYAGDDAAEASSRARRELDALRVAEGEGAPRAIELISDMRPPILVTERVRGVSLASHAHPTPLSSDTFLGMAIQLTRVLGRIHQTGLIHCSVNPQNVQIDPDTFETHLMGFSAARTLGSIDRIESVAMDVGDPAAVLAYVSPEQTGRMARGVDSRSDLYSLGATFYFALTGAPPFDSSDPLALVHAQLARMPAPPIERRSSVPATLSRIVMKLLQKEPSDRYQTAHALARDLEECGDQLQRTGRISDDFPLGAADVPMRPLFSTRLYGRDRELQALREAYKRARVGEIELVIFSGPPGVGKSSLMHELRTGLAGDGGYLAQGKFDLYRRDVPYSGWIAALESLTQQILAESETRLEHWRALLTEALGSLASVVIELVPDLGIVVKDAPPVPKLGAREAQARLVYALQRLVLGCARPEHPLLLFLDDLQWADPGSRAVLEALLAQTRGASLLVVATCRDEDEAAWSPVVDLIAGIEQRDVRVTRVAVGPMPLDATMQMLADALDQPLEQVRGLAACVASKTGNNPLLIQQFIEHVRELGLIHYVHPAGWSWDEAAIVGAGIPEGAVGLMIAKLERLAVKPRAVIQFASCVGDEFEIELLCQLTGEPRDSLETPLFELAKEGLIAPSTRGFRFVHDRIREAAQALLSEDERSRLHHRTAIHLLEQAPLIAFTDRVFEIADHFNRGIARLSESERVQALEIDVAAGARALASGAFHTANAYLSAARSLLQECDWEARPELAFNALIQSAEALNQIRNFELSLEIVEALETRPLTRMQQGIVAAKRVSCINGMRPEDALGETLAQLRRVGVHLPNSPSRLRVLLEFAYTDWLLRGPLDASGFGRKPSKNPAWAVPMVILGAGGAALVRGGGLRLVCLTLNRSLRSLRANGAMPGLSYWLAAYTGARIGMRRDLIGAERYIQAAFEWMERLPSPLNTRAGFSLHCFSLPYLKPRRALLQPLRLIAEAARELGDPEYAAYASGYRWSVMALCGEPIARLLAELERLQQHAPAEPLQRMYAAWHAVYASLQDSAEHPRDWTEDPPAISEELRRRADGDVSVALHWFMVLCHMGRFEQAAALLPRFNMTAFSTNPSASFDFRMFRSICISAQAESKGRWARRRAAFEMRWLMRLTNELVRDESDFASMRLVVEAESARLLGRVPLAIGRYQHAAKLANDRGYIHHAALIHERRASALLLQRRDLEARTALRQAAELYNPWGAVAKASELDKRRSE